MRMFFAGLLVVALLASGCTRKATAPPRDPKSLQECLAVAADQKDEAQLAVGQRACRERFSFRNTGDGLPEGQLFYPDLASCSSIGFIDGESSATGNGLCAGGAKFDRTSDGGLTFKCNRVSEPPWAFNGFRTSDGIALRDTGKAPTDLTLFWSSAQCEKQLADAWNSAMTTDAGH